MNNIVPNVGLTAVPPVPKCGMHEVSRAQRIKWNRRSAEEKEEKKDNSEHIAIGCDHNWTKCRVGPFHHILAITY